MAIINDMPMLVGIVGIVLIFIGYVCTLFGKLKEDSIAFDLLNIIGASLLAYYTYVEGALFFTALLIVWGLVALINMIKTVVKR